MPLHSWHWVSQSCRPAVSIWMTGWACPIAGNQAHIPSPMKRSRSPLARAGNEPLVQTLGGFAWLRLGREGGGRTAAALSREGASQETGPEQDAARLIWLEGHGAAQTHLPPGVGLVLSSATGSAAAWSWKNSARARACFRKLPGCLGRDGCFPTRSKPSGQQMMFTSCDIILKSNII